MTFALDHVVINTLFDMNRAADLMLRLGFTLTPRGYHSLGSINHLMMLEHDYLELVGAIEATAEEREAIRLAIKDYPASGSNAADIKRVRDRLEPQLPAYDIAAARYFHLACDLLTIAFLWAKEWRRRKPEPSPVTGSELRRTSV